MQSATAASSCSVPPSLVCTAARLAKKIAFEGSSSMAALYDASASSSFPARRWSLPFSFSASAAALRSASGTFGVRLSSFAPASAGLYLA